MFTCIKRAAVGMAGNYAKEYLTVDNITEWLVQAVNSILENATKNVDDATMAQTCETITKMSDLCGKLAKAIADKKVTVEEAQDIIAELKDIITTSGVTDGYIANGVDALVDKIKARID